jgi:hypothetical protein
VKSSVANIRIEDLRDSSLIPRILSWFSNWSGKDVRYKVSAAEKDDDVTVSHRADNRDVLRENNL